MGLESAVVNVGNQSGIFILILGFLTGGWAVIIAGLVAGASEGEGLGNAFLSHIQAVDGIFHVVRAFEDPDIMHNEGDVNPVRDMEIINNELFAKDIQ